MSQTTAKRRRSNSRSRTANTNKQRHPFRWLRLESLEPRTMLTGTWTALTNLAPTTTPGLAELLPDGTVMGTGAQSWFKLTPDSSGSYVNGTFSSLASMSTGRVYDATNVLPDGRVFVLGDASNGSMVNTGEMYSPLTNTWTGIAPFPEPTFGNGPTTLLADGRILAGSTSGPNTYIYDPANNTWSNGPTKLFGDSNLHEHWTKLSDGSILTYDVNSNPGEAQRLDQSTMTWIDSGSVPVSLQSGSANLGSGVLLPDGRVLQIGANSNTAIYTPATTPGDTGNWSAGPVIPDGLIGGQSGLIPGNLGNDYGSCSAAMMPNGHVLFVAGYSSKVSDHYHLFEFDPAAPSEPSLTDVTPTFAGGGSLGFVPRMLVLPSGQVLTVLGGSTNGVSTPLYVYTPDGAPQAAWKPTIASIVANGNHYTLTGTQLNGLSVGASYGVGAEMDSNYPIVELKDGTGKVYFAKTSNWSSTGVATGSAPVTTDFTLPAGLPLATYQLTVVANGIASDPTSFTSGFTGADLTIARQDPVGGPFSYSEGDQIPYYFNITNYGPSAATKAVVTDTLGANLRLAATGSSQGTIKQSGNVITFSLGTIAVGQTVTVSVLAQAMEDGTLTDTAVVSSNVSDANLLNNTAVASDNVAEPAIVVSAPLSVTGKNQSNVAVATFTHASGVEAPSDFVATINWGDGSTSIGTITQSGITYKVKGSHTYSANGSRTVTTTVAESESAMSSMALIASISTQANSTVKNGPAVQTQSTATTDPPKLTPAAVDLILDTAPLNRRSPALHTSFVELSDDLLADLFTSL